MINIYVLLASGRLRPVADAVQTSVQATCDLVEQALTLSDVDIVIRDDRFRFIPEWGIGGFAPDAHTIQISLDATRVDDPMLQARLPATVAHELHHTARWLGPGYGLRLFEAIVTEGLADHFACELLDQPPPPWTQALTSEQIAATKAAAEPELDTPTHDHGAWFFGTQPDRIPRWAGYTLGWQIVQRYLDQEPTRDAAQLAIEPSPTFRESLSTI